MNDEVNTSGVATAMEPDELTVADLLEMASKPVPAETTASPATAEIAATTAPAEEPLLRTQDIAKVLNASYGQVRWYLTQGYIKSRHVPSGGRRTFVVKKSDLEAWLSKPGQRVRFRQVNWDRLK